MEEALRFGVSGGNELQASTWKLWRTGTTSDVYLACRALGGVLKVSLHQSANWHIAYTPEGFEGHVKGAILSQPDRFLSKWTRPSPFASGMTLALRIITPFSAVKEKRSNGSHGVTWIPNCLPGNATEIDLVVVEASTKVSGWPGRTSMRTKLIGSLSLPNGDTVWAVHHVIPLSGLPSNTRGRPQFYKGRSPADLRPAGLRALAFGEEPDGSRVIYDCAVELANKEVSMEAGVEREDT